MSRCFVSFVKSEQFRRVTGYALPNRPSSPKQYNDSGLPWFDYYDSDQWALDGAKPLAGLDSVAAREIKLAKVVLVENEPLDPRNVISLTKKSPLVRDGQW